MKVIYFVTNQMAQFFQQQSYDATTRLDNSITFEEVRRKAVQKLEKSKLVGLDEAMNEVLKYSGI